MALPQNSRMGERNALSTCRVKEKERERGGREGGGRERGRERGREGDRERLVMLDIVWLKGQYMYM